MRRKDVSRLREDPVIYNLYPCLAGFGIDAYLVGGVVRNIICNIPVGYDYDFALTGKIRDAAERIAFTMHGSPFPLDKAAGSYRIVIKGGAYNSINIDLSLVSGRGITEDVLTRDFTINAVAVDIKELFEKDNVSLIDPLNGARDARERHIIPVKDDIFDADPIRMLRAVRLAAQHSFNIDSRTEKLIKEKSYLLKTTSWERIRDDFFAILDCCNAAYNLKRLYELGLLKEIFPEIKDWEKLKGYDLLSHVIKAVAEGENLIYGLKGFIPVYEELVLQHFKSPASGNISRSAFFRFVLFLHDAGKAFTMKSDDKCLRFTGHDAEGEAIAKKIARRLKLSRRLLVSLGKIVRNHHRVFNIASLEKVSLRSKAHFFRVMDIDGLDLLFLSIADARATRGSEDHELEELVKELIPFYFDTYRVRKMPPILKGDEIMKIFQIPEGIIVGRILKKVQEAEGMGIVNDKEEAVEFIRGWLHGKAKGVDI
ncbi:MAG: hypothetical protein A2073_05290 [Deltaproteobacteria bacterium GWC2_42_11]|nr:MAG: hypothetical protein A2073_05290 [Deltaproteobacteria bacterium GWC2_42_11]